jgi:hypothetical protein
MATDPEQSMSLRSPAGRQAAGFEGELQELAGFAAMAFPPFSPPPQPPFFPSSPCPASGIRPRCPRCLAAGPGHVAMSQIPTMSAFAGVSACWASSVANTQTGSCPIASAVAAVVR